MVYVRFWSIYTEIDRFGSRRSIENGFEASGMADEVCRVLDTVMKRIQLPGTRPVGLYEDVRKYLTNNS